LFDSIKRTFVNVPLFTPNDILFDLYSLSFYYFMHAYVFPSTKLVVRAEQNLPGTGWEERMGEGSRVEK
jgi:hypothetical protein